MTPKEKAKEIFEKFYNIKGGHNTMFWDDAIICALIAVDEILEATATEYQIQYDNGEWSREIGFRYSDFWQEVKQEIENL